MAIKKTKTFKCKINNSYESTDFTNVTQTMPYSTESPTLSGAGDSVNF